MSQYYTALNISNEGYIGTVYNSATNQPVYTTKAHPSQFQASQDINNFLATGNNPEGSPKTVTNTTVYRPELNTPKLPSQQPTRSCCGRR
jgi:hypothetical protein